MKKSLFTIIILLACVRVFATQISVSNSTQNPGQYSTIAAAITAASAGDTLLVHPTATNYGNFSLNKKLVIIGGGFNVQKTNPFYTTFGGITLQPGCDGSRFFGFRVGTVSTTTSAGAAMDSLFFEDIYFTQYLGFFYSFYPTNLVVRNCIVDFINLSSATSSSATISHCIFEGDAIEASTGSLLVEYCLFQGSTNQLNGVSGAVIQNCILYDGNIGSISLSTFNNCMSFNLTNNTLPPGTNIGSGNQSGVDPLFVNNPINQAFSFTRDYHLQVGSPALTAATDGGQIGVYGGPNATFSLSGEPLNSPIVRDFIITNAAVPVNGNLDIDVTITKPLDQ